MGQRTDSWTEPVRRRRRGRSRFVLCLADSEPDLQARKLYQVLPDKAAARDHYLRVIDESGEDYLYPEHFFTPIEVPREAQTALSGNASKVLLYPNGMPQR